MARYQKDLFELNGYKLNIDRTNRVNFTITKDDKDVAEVKYNRKQDDVDLTILNKKIDVPEFHNILNLYNWFLMKNDLKMGKVFHYDRMMHRYNGSIPFPREIMDTLSYIQKDDGRCFYIESDKLKYLEENGFHYKGIGTRYHFYHIKKDILEDIVVREGADRTYIEIDDPDVLKNRKVYIQGDHRHYFEFHLDTSSMDHPEHIIMPELVFEHPEDELYIQIIDKNRGSRDDTHKNDFDLSAWNNLNVRKLVISSSPTNNIQHNAYDKDELRRTIDSFKSLSQDFLLDKEQAHFLLSFAYYNIGVKEHLFLQSTDPDVLKSDLLEKIEPLLEKSNDLELS